MRSFRVHYVPCNIFCRWISKYRNKILYYRYDVTTSVYMSCSFVCWEVLIIDLSWSYLAGWLSWCSVTATEHPTFQRTKDLFANNTYILENEARNNCKGGYSWMKAGRYGNNEMESEWMDRGKIDIEVEEFLTINQSWYLVYNLRCNESAEGLRRHLNCSPPERQT